MHPLRESGCRVFKTEGFLRFFFGRIHPSQSGLKPCGFRGVSEWSETVWFQRGFRVVWNCVVLEGFQSGLKPCGFRKVLEWSKTVWFQRGFRVVWNRVVSERFQTGLKPCGFREVLLLAVFLFFCLNANWFRRAGHINSSGWLEKVKICYRIFELRRSSFRMWDSKTLLQWHRI